eukprot:CAMPEP_0184694860 /NCGR_PEP_ID=MMETSP0313-20130426/2687_1 /TAXON_ID=2792 /ORGANISM="Porphyridium aerugineum, Strain SAG 1380-2" /LENGTH=483 /DNA_ID=CAMNT_0027153219 /DNA_START=487 /DNA_END=1938 /DNA_ORIENTATION=-
MSNVQKTKSGGGGGSGSNDLPRAKSSGAAPDVQRKKSGGAGGGSGSASNSGKASASRTPVDKEKSMGQRAKSGDSKGMSQRSKSSGVQGSSSRSGGAANGPPRASPGSNPAFNALKESQNPLSTSQNVFQGAMILPEDVIEDEELVRLHPVERGDRSVPEGSQHQTPSRGNTMGGRSGSGNSEKKGLFFRGKSKKATIDDTIENLTSDNYFLNTGDDARGSGMGGRAKSMKRSLVLKQPVMIAAPYGKLWSLDVLALYHNAIKKELIDMYSMVENMLKFQMNLGYSDIERFYNWWEVFEGFLVDYFEIEEQVLFPYIETKFQLERTKLSKAERNLIKGRLTQAMNQIDDMEDTFMNRPPGEVLPRFVDFLDAFAPRLLGYFHIENTVIPNALQKYFEPEDRARIQALVFDFLKTREFGNETLVLQSRWLTENHLKTWKQETLRGTSRVAYPMWRAKLEKVHGAVVREFKQISLEEELHALGDT